MNLLLTVFVSAGVMLVGLSIPLIRRRIGPNPWYGFRVPATTNDPDIWYPVNEYMAWRLLWTGITVVLVSVGAYFVADISEDTYGLVIGAVVLIGLGVTVLQSFIYLGKMKKERSS